MNSNRFSKTTCLLGIFAVVLAWIVIAASWILNPWFHFLKNAFSDLGVPSNTRYWWVYDYGLIIVGIIIILYGFLTYLWAVNKLEAVAAGYLVIAGIFLALIGIFPGGTRPHVFVSSWFFIQMDLAIILLSFSLWYSRKWRTGLYLLALSLLAWPIFIVVELTVGWPSVAAGETYGIIIIDIVIIASSYYQCQYGKGSF